MKTSVYSNPTKLPSRWKTYSKMGKPIEGTRFIIFKAPLDYRYDQFGGDFSMEEALDTHKNIGKIIDFTYPKNFYNPSDYIDNYGISYTNIPLRCKKKSSY